MVSPGAYLSGMPVPAGPAGQPTSARPGAPTCGTDAPRSRGLPGGGGSAPAGGGAPPSTEDPAILARNLKRPPAAGASDTIAVRPSATAMTNAENVTRPLASRRLTGQEPLPRAKMNHTGPA